MWAQTIRGWIHNQQVVNFIISEQTRTHPETGTAQSIRKGKGALRVIIGVYSRFNLMLLRGDPKTQPRNDQNRNAKSDQSRDPKNAQSRDPQNHQSRDPQNDESRNPKVDQSRDPRHYQSIHPKQQPK